MEYLYNLLIIIIGLIVSIIVGLIVGKKENDKNPENAKGTWFYTLEAAVIGTTLTTLILLQVNLEDFLNLKSQIVNQSEYDKLLLKRNNLSVDDPLSVPLSDYVSRTKEELSDAINGYIRLDDEEEVINEWRRFFRDSQSRHIKATNIITPNYWFEGNPFSQEQLEIQSNAIKNDFIIQRVFIYEEDESENLGLLKKLADQQRAIDINVRFITAQRLQSLPIFLKNRSKLRGTEDFVISDYNLVLLTIPDPITRDISYGHLTSNRETVDIALEIFDTIWRNSNIRLE